jgi:glutathione S-transferase
MLTLCGFSASNYYNKVKLALMEKEVPFHEKLVWVDRSPALLEKSPLGKVPYFEIGDKVLFESQVMLDYVEATYPQKPLLPADTFEAARIRELIQYMELHLELVARELYAEAFFGGKISDETKVRVQKILKRSIAGFGRIAKFSPYIAGDQFTMADCAAICHLPMVGMATKAIYGEDMMADYPVRDYLKQVGERPTVQQVTADRKANAIEMTEWIKSQKKA